VNSPRDRQIGIYGLFSSSQNADRQDRMRGLEHSTTVGGRIYIVIGIQYSTGRQHLPLSVINPKTRQSACLDLGCNNLEFLLPTSRRLIAH
jgi:hypothetical protein